MGYLETVMSSEHDHALYRNRFEAEGWEQLFEYVRATLQATDFGHSFPKHRDTKINLAGQRVLIRQSNAA